MSPSFKPRTAAWVRSETHAWLFYVLDMVLGGAPANHELPCDFRIRLSQRQKFQHFQFARRQPLGQCAVRLRWVLRSLSHPLEGQSLK